MNRSSDIANPVSILNTDEPSDMAETDCPYHNIDRVQIKSIVGDGGAAYILSDPFRLYICRPCLDEIAALLDDELDLEDASTAYYQYVTTEFFDMWDRGDSPGDWFEYLGEMDELEDNTDVVIDFDGRRINDFEGDTDD